MKKNRMRKRLKPEQSNIMVLLINPKSKDEAPFYPPYALLWIASYLEKNSVGVVIYDRNVDSRSLRQVLSEQQPKIAGITCLTGETLLDVRKVLDGIKKYDSTIKTILGGVHVSLLPELSLNERGVNFVVFGEGEETMLELVENINNPASLSQIKGLGFKNSKGKVILNQAREFIEDLNTLPDPAWHLIDMEKYFHKTFYAKKMVILNTSRGCPHRCSFCYNQTYNRRKYRYLNADRLISQVEYFKENYGIDGVQFFEDEFDVDPERVKRFCQEVIKRKMNINWQIGSRVNYATKERFKLLKRAGCQLIEFGVESGSQRMLDFLHKDITIEQIKNAFNLAKEVGIKANALFMIGLPTETMEELNETLALIESLPTFNVICSIFKPYPGTELFELCVKRYKIKTPRNFEEFARSYNFGSVTITATDIPTTILTGTLSEMIGKNIFDTLRICLKELRLRYLFELIFEKLKTIRGNHFHLFFIARLRQLFRFGNDSQVDSRSRELETVKKEYDPILRWIKQYIGKLVKEKKSLSILDVGCGDGYWTELFCVKSNKVTGMDIIRSFRGNVHFEFVKGNAKKMPFADFSFDLITSFDVIEHLKADKEFLREAKRVLKNKGELVIGTPNRERISSLILKLLGKDLSFPRNLGYNSSYGDIVHEREYTRGEISELLRQSEFKISSLSMVWFGIFYRRIILGLVNPPPFLARFANYILIRARKI